MLPLLLNVYTFLHILNMPDYVKSNFEMHFEYFLYHHYATKSQNNFNFIIIF